MLKVARAFCLHVAMPVPGTFMSRVVRGLRGAGGDFIRMWRVAADFERETITLFVTP